MGDSYSSGEGNPPFDRGTANTKTGDTCHRSAEAWPRLLAGEDHGLHLLGLAACSGAITDDIYVDPSKHPDTFKTELPQVTQLKNLNPRADAVVTITIGGDDVGFASAFADCYRHDCYSDGTLAAFVSKIKHQLPKELATTYKSISAAVPAGTQVIVVGYPNILTTSGWDRKLHCGLWLTGQEWQGMLSAAQDLDRAEKAAATSAGIGYASMLGVLAGHEMCTGKSWIKSVNVLEARNPSTRQQFAHPLLAGQNAIAQAVDLYLATPHYSGNGINVTGQLGVPLSASATITGGVTPLTVFPGIDGTVPSWLGFGAAGRVASLGGTPESAGSWAFNMVVEDSNGNEVSIPVKLTVTTASPSPSPSPTPSPTPTRPDSWTASEAPLPANAATYDPIDGYVARIYGISCPSSSSCVAVGFYTDKSGDTQGLLLTWSGGSWSAAQAPVPANATSGEYGVFILGVSCASVSDCVAVGSYTDSSGYQGLLLTMSGGSWTPTEAPLPAKAYSNPGEVLDAVSCLSDSQCIASGRYQDASNEQQGLLLTLSRGSWNAAQAPVPANATRGEYGTEVFGLSCPTSSKCIAVGMYPNSSTTEGGMLLTLSGGSWSAAQTPLPANADARASHVSGVSCASASDCVAVGYYTDSSGAQGLLVTLSGGSWTPAEAPNGVMPFLDSVSCPSASECVAFSSEVTNGQPVLLTLSGGSWSTAEASLPANAAIGGDTEVLGVSCPSVSTCVAVGDYPMIQQGVPTQQGLLLSGPA